MCLQGPFARTVLGLLCGITIAPSVLAVEPSQEVRKHVAEEGETVEFFTALDSRKILAQFIPSDASKAKVIIKNVSDRPLDIVLPKSFAGLPVLAQIGNQGGIPGQNGFGFPGGLGAGNGQGLGLGNGGFGNGQGGGSQALGGGFPQGQNGFGNQNGFPNAGGPGRGLFRVDEGRSRKIDVKTVCLEYGKPDPNPRLQYKIVRLSEYTSSPRIEWLCNRLSEGTFSQNVAQAAAWNLANGLSWRTLASIDRRNSRYTGREKYFNSNELAVARTSIESLPTESSQEFSDYQYSSNSPSFSR